MHVLYLLTFLVFTLIATSYVTAPVCTSRSPLDPFTTAIRLGSD